MKIYNHQLLATAVCINYANIYVCIHIYIILLCKGLEIYNRNMLTHSSYRIFNPKRSTDYWVASKSHTFFNYEWAKRTNFLLAVIYGYIYISYYFYRFVHIFFFAGWFLVRFINRNRSFKLNWYYLWLIERQKKISINICIDFKKRSI